MTYTLRIKKEYYLKILSGEKSKEYRSVKPFYSKLSSDEWKYLKIHYQGDRFLICSIDRIRKIKRPDFLSNIGIDFTDKVYEISLSNPQEFFSK